MRAKPSIDEPSKPMPSVEGAFELFDGDGEALQEAEDVREPQPDELDVQVVGHLQHIFRVFRLVTALCAFNSHIYLPFLEKRTESPGNNSTKEGFKHVS